LCIRTTVSASSTGRSVSTHSGWSVVVTGRAAVVTDPAGYERLSWAGLRSWAASPREVFVRIEADLVAGREIVGGKTTYGVDFSS
jgi:hypothetical protein